MASIRHEVMIEAAADKVWDAVRDVGAIHTRLAPDFVTDTKLEPGARRTLAGFEGYEVLEPEAGDLACGREGTGRLADVARIVARVESVLQRSPSVRRPSA